MPRPPEDTGTPAPRPPRQPRRDAQRLVRSMLRLQAEQIDEITILQARALLPVLEQARRELRSELAAWLATAPEAGARWTAHHKRNAIVMVERAVRRMSRFVDLRGEVERVLTDQAVEMAHVSTRHLNNELARFAEWFEGSIHPVALREATAVVEGTSFLVPRYRTSAARYVGSVRADIKNRIAVGFAKNETFDGVIRDLRRHGGPRGRVALRGVVGEPGAVVEDISEGLFKRYRYWAERIVRTEGISAYNVAKQHGIRQAAEEDKELARRWDASLDSRVCVICRRAHGEIRGIEELFSIGVLHPPGHPNCRCAVLPWKRSWPNPDERPDETQGTAPDRATTQE